jgi:DNA-binding NarL/FixJ family response regulator
MNQRLANHLLHPLANGTQEETTSEAFSEAEFSEAPQPLTPRELQVLELLQLGQTNQETARGLGISLSTVKRHVENILDKLKFSYRINYSQYLTTLRSELETK